MPNHQLRRTDPMLILAAQQYGGLDRPAPQQFLAYDELTELERVLLERAEAQGLRSLAMNAIMDERKKKKDAEELGQRVANIEGFLSAAVQAAQNNRNPQPPRKRVENANRPKELGW